MDRPLLSEEKDKQGAPPPSKKLLDGLYLGVMCSVGLTSNILCSLIAPILPNKFIDEGIDPVWVGFVFAILPIAILLCSPRSNDLSAKYGRCPILSVGLVIQGVSALFFGYVPSFFVGMPNMMLSSFLFLRAFQGVGCAMCNLAIFSMVADRFSDSLGFVMGLNEVIIGLGFCAGPPVGAILAGVADFYFPFVAGGLLVLCTIPPVMIIERMDPDAKPGQDANKNAPDDGKTAFQRILSVCTLPLLIPSGFLLIGTSIFGLVEPIYAIHSQEYLNTTPVVTGYLLGWLSVVYSTFGMPAGNHADRTQNYTPTLITGCAISATSLILFGVRDTIFEYFQVPLNPIHEPTYAYNLKFYTDALFLMIMGIGQAGCLVPTLPAMKEGITGKVPKTVKDEENQAAKEAEVDPDQARKTEAVVTLFNIFQQGGLVVGPVIGALLNKYEGYDFTCLVGGLSTMAYVVWVISARKFYPETACPPAYTGPMSSR